MRNILPGMMSQNNLTDLYVESSVPCVPIVPVLGEIVEIRFDTVGNVLYAWVTERGSNDCGHCVMHHVSMGTSCCLCLSQ